MKSFTTRGAAALLALAALVSAGAAQPARPKRAAGAERAVAFKGVGFYYDAALASRVKAEFAGPGECGKPGDVTPVHVAFTFEGYPKPHPEPFMRPPELYVFPVAAYRRAMAECEREMAAVTTPPADYFVSGFDDQLRTLRALNAARPAPRELAAWLKRNRAPEYLKGELPLLPMYDVCEALRARVRYLDFRNGRGVAFVAQYTIESTLISNQALAYVFQGITDDGEYYVSAAFPIAAPFLPADFSDEEAAKLGLDYGGGMTGPKFQRRYKKYVAATERRLDALAPDGYRPRLGLLDELIRSLNVNGELLKSSINAK